MSLSFIEAKTLECHEAIKGFARLMETISKKYIIAERTYDSSILENLTFLCISDYPDFKVLSLYSDLSKKLLAYKIIQQNSEYTDAWITKSWLKVVSMDFNPDFELIPSTFSEDTSAEDNTPFVVLPSAEKGFAHYAEGIRLYNSQITEKNKIYLFLKSEQLNVLIFEGKNCVFNNSFHCNNETEMLYYLVSALDISGMKQEDVHLYLDYNLIVKADIVNSFKSYFKNLKPMLAPMDEPDPEIPHLQELLFANYLLSLCG